MRNRGLEQLRGLLECDWVCPARSLVLLHADGHMLLPVPTGGSARGLREGGQRPPEKLPCSGGRS